MNFFGNNGTRFFDGTSAFTSQRIAALRVRENTVFTVLTFKHIDGSTADMAGVTTVGIGSKTMLVDDWIVAERGFYISELTMSSGSCMGYLYASL